MARKESGYVEACEFVNSLVASIARSTSFYCHVVLQHLRIELKIALKVFQRAEVLNISTADVLKDDDAITSGKVASIVARNAINVIGNISFAASLYEMVYTMGRTDDMPEDLWHPVCELILRIITEKFENDVDYFTCRAEFCLLPLRLMSRKSEHETLKAEDESYKVFDEAVKARDTGTFCKEFWWSELEFHQELFRGCSNVPRPQSSFKISKFFW